VESEGRLLPLGPPKQRALLVLLLLRHNRVVSRDELLDALWGERPPETAISALQGYIAALRKVLGAARIETRATGYRLLAAPGELDVARFDRLVSEARALDPAEAHARYTAALSLWRDVPLSELESAPFVEGERRRLSEDRLGAIEGRYEASLALGQHAHIVGELSALVTEHPLRERLRGELMLALYRSGRASEALDVYRSCRHLLAGEFGLEPGEPLRRLERAILDRDSALDAHNAPRPAAVEVASEPLLPPARALRRRRGLLTVAAAVVAVVAVLAIALFLSRDGTKAITVAANSIAVVDPHTNRIVADIRVGSDPVSVAVGAGGVWVGTAGTGTVVRIDPATRKVVATIRLGTDVTAVAAGEGGVWVGNGNDGTITRIDPETNTVRDTIFAGEVDPLVPTPVFAVAVGAGAAWATRGDHLLRIDTATDSVVWSKAIPTPRGLAAGPSGVWVTTVAEQLLRIPPDRPERASTLELPAQTAAPALGGNSVWLVAYQRLAAVWQVDPRALVNVATSGALSADVSPRQLAFGAGGLWSVDYAGGVRRFDPGDLHVVAQLATGLDGAAIAVGAGAVWVAVSSAPTGA
jgi:DNA-binding SARP family transcriptional activator